jgi:hypothetical protein
MEERPMATLPRKLSCAVGISAALLYFWLTAAVLAPLSMALIPALAWPQSAPPAGENSPTEDLTPPPRSLTIKPPAIMIEAGEPQRLRLVDDRGRGIPDAVWTVSEPAHVEIRDHGEVMLTGLSPGMVIVIANWRNLKAQAKVMVLESSTLRTNAAPDAVVSMRINPVGLGIWVGQSRPLQLEDNQGRPIHGARWTVSDATRVKLMGDAEVTALAAGSVMVTATWRNLTAQAKVTVLADSSPIPADKPVEFTTPHDTPISPGIGQSDSERFEMTPYIVNMVAGGTHRLRMWDNALRHAVTDAEWTVSDPNVVVIEGGPDAVILGRAPGKVTVTATWQGHQTEAIITVYPGTLLPTGTVIWSLKPHPGQTKPQVAPSVPN